MDALFLKIINMSIAASWLILAVILLRIVLKKAPKWINVLLWGIVAVRLLCPISFESSLSLVPNAEPIPQDIFMMEPSENHESPVFDPVENSNLPDVPSVSVDASIEQIQWKSVFATFGWIFGIGAMLIYAAISYILVRCKIKASLHLRDNIWICDDIQTPFILGAVKPRIYIPSGTDEAQLPHIIAHENAHLKRRDQWWKPLGFLVLTIHWFNPLVWVAYILLCRDIELACDEKVIRELNQSESIAYSEALLSCSVNRRTVMVCPLAFGEVGVKERVKRVLNYKKPAFWIVVVAVIASVVLAVCFLTNPKAFGDSITLVNQSTPARGNAFTYDVSFGQNVMSGTVHAEQWSNGTCVKSSPVVLTNEVDEINILMDVRREDNSPVGVDIQVDTNEYGGSLITYFAFPENNSIIGWGCEGYSLNESVQIQPETEKILAAMVFDVGNGVRAFGTEDLIIDPERLENADYAIVIRASFDSTNLGNANKEATPVYSSFNATVLEIHDGYYLVEPVEGSWELSSADRIEVPIRNAVPSPEPEVGDTIEIEYSGDILESYPAQIANVYGMRVVEEAEQWDLIPMVMVNGTLYLDTGHESTVEGRCGVMDGEITSQVDGSKKPTVDNQSNFGVGYGYQYGPTEGTIEIYMNEQWRVFATEEVRREIQFPTTETEFELNLGGNTSLDHGMELTDEKTYWRITIQNTGDSAIRMSVEYDTLLYQVEPGETKVFSNRDPWPVGECNVSFSCAGVSGMQGNVVCEISPSYLNSGSPDNSGTDWPVNEWTEGIPAPTNGNVAWTTQQGELYAITIENLAETDFIDWLGVLEEAGFTKTVSATEPVNQEYTSYNFIYAGNEKGVSVSFAKETLVLSISFQTN